MTMDASRYGATSEDTRDSVRIQGKREFSRRARTAA